MWPCRPLTAAGLKPASISSLLVHLRSAKIVASKLPSVRLCSLRSCRIRRVRNSGRIGVEQSGSRLNTYAFGATVVRSISARSSISLRCSLRKATVAVSSATVRRLRVLVCFSTTTPPASLIAASTVSSARSRCKPVATEARKLSSAEAGGHSKFEDRGEDLVVFVGGVEQSEQFVDLRCRAHAGRLAAARKLEQSHRVVRDHAVALAPLVRAAQSGSCVVHPAVRQLGPAHPSEGFVEVGQGDRAGAPGADEIAEPMRVGVFVADERRVLEPTLLASELEVPLDQRVDGQLLVAMAGQQAAVADLGHQGRQRLGGVGARPVVGPVGASAMTVLVAAGGHADPPGPP